jgi:hypothetical protein
MRFVLDGEVMLIEPRSVILAGFTGRDRSVVTAHLEELAHLGVPVPETVPSFYSVPPHLVIQDSAVAVRHDETSGEAEIAVVETGKERLVTVASDHTDRVIEAQDIHASKLACPKVIAKDVWRFDDVADHWDALELRSWIDGDELYQEGVASDLLHPDQVLALAPIVPFPILLLTGTLPTIAGIRRSVWFRAQLSDPQLDRRIEVAYRAEVAGSPAEP